MGGEIISPHDYCFHNYKCTDTSSFRRFLPVYLNGCLMCSRISSSRIHSCTLGKDMSPSSESLKSWINFSPSISATLNYSNKKVFSPTNPVSLKLLKRIQIDHVYSRLCVSLCNLLNHNTIIRLSLGQNALFS